ncbi:hypothetical protein [Phycicoccus sp. 3266]|uniref:hypothetical protein n=1 Tax=Phycicoccus sp. 3266 TaxID=2817751 RepID=UPI002860488F|nr:hypothetical protein [Phycicoccus sp. 3266]MDR6865116.1 putative membrane protein [Phycicoccus sp. 3266]
MIKKKSVTLAGAAFFAVPAAAILAAGPAMAASGSGVLVSNTETIQAYLNASGKVDVARVYEQVAMEGRGTVNLANPVETKGLRNLDGFGGFEVKGGQMVGSYTVDGEKRLRSVSDYTKRLPLEVDVKYFMDGKQVQPGDVVGKNGNLKVQYTVRNVTGKPQEVSFNDGTGKTTTATADVVIPMVGSLTTVLPSNFTDVRSDEANMAGDGHGGTKMSFTMTLFGPIGKPEATFGYEARVSDGVVPKASISALPVSPLDSPSFKGGAESYKGGAETGATLTAGATEIDSNLLKLRDGAGDLLAGLIKLRDGANQLHDGLAGQAAPGAAKLAAGAGDLKNGTGQLRDGAAKAKDGSSQVAGGATQVAGGAAQLDDGAGQLLDGLTTAGQKAPQLLDGLAQVADGLDLLDAGLVKLHGGIGELPTKAQPLHDGIAQLRAGIGDKGQANTLIDGVDQIRAGLAAATADKGSLDQLKAGVDASKAGVDASKAGVDKSKIGVDQSKGGVDQSKGGVDQVLQGLQAALAPGGDIDQAKAAINSISATCGVGNVVCQGTVAAVASGVEAKLRNSTGQASDGLTQVSGGLGAVSGGLSQVSGGLSQVSGGLGQVSDGLGLVSPGLAQLKSKLGDAVVGLVKVECGLSNQTLTGLCDPKRPGLLEGLGALDGGVTLLVNGVVDQVQSGVGGDTDTKEDGTLRGGVHSLQGGVDQIGAGGVTLLDGLYQLGGGAAMLKDGTSQLAGGSAQLADGAKQLDSGLGDLSSGAGQLDDGAGQLKDGANKLSTGLGDAANGSTQLADGLDQAASGAPKIKDGAQQLSDQGTKKLIEAGKSTAADYGQKYALIEAGAKRAKAEGMAYGAPAGAAGQTAYSFELAGDDGEGGRNVGRGLGAAVVFALAAGAAMLRRRVV